jgi:hypothetical protein
VPKKIPENKILAVKIIKLLFGGIFLLFKRYMVIGSAPEPNGVI